MFSLLRVFEENVASRDAALARPRLLSHWTAESQVAFLRYRYLLGNQGTERTHRARTRVACVQCSNGRRPSAPGDERRISQAAAHAVDCRANTGGRTYAHNHVRDMIAAYAKQLGYDVSLEPGVVSCAEAVGVPLGQACALAQQHFAGTTPEKCRLDISISGGTLDETLVIDVSLVGSQKSGFEAALRNRHRAKVEEESLWKWKGDL